MEQILIVEDDTDLREGLSFALEREGYRITCVGTKYEGLLQGKKQKWDLVILDCNLPDGSGFDFLEELHRFCETPVLMLTARNTEMDEIKALELGVADYMSKPFSLAVLKARIRHIFQASAPSTTLSCAGLIIDRNTCSVCRDGEVLALSRVEYQLLCYLIENRNQVLTKEQILAHVWDTRGKFVDENTLSVTVRRLRAKVEHDPKHPKLIRTVHGIGYIWKEGEG